MGIQHEGIKEMIWRVLVNTWRCLPVTVRNLFCRLSFAAASEHKDAAASLRELLALHERLEWFIDRSAIRYGGGSHPKHRLMNYHAFFISRLRQGENVLDAGCGYGQVAYTIANAGWRVTGIDFDQQRINRAQERYRNDNLSFLCGDITNLLGENSFDVVILSNVIEHIENREKLLHELYGRTGATRVLLRVPMSTRNWMVPLRKELGMFSYCDPTHVVEYTVDELLAELESFGLRIVCYVVNWGEIWAEAQWHDEKP
ncbi:MAG: hypothetical protein BWK76_19215 [Desulfobulbaceae bacterium A2]|nr:MAG: hypothetical protein BWK76_19215 [Desulfobulbaceae bacterium A2]